MNNYKIRKALVEDLSAIIQMLAEDDLENNREDVKNRTPYLSAFMRIYSDANQELMVMEDYYQNVIGTFQLSMIPYLTSKGGIRAQIEAISIHKDCKIEEVSRQMIAWAIERAKINGAYLIQVSTNSCSEAFISCLNSFGFEEKNQGLKLKLV
ncbi:GNAT family N-acetyltransferase [Robiginitalea sp. IMCC44478]|uniref:GNAT family N-acetyltransferase n=1 Tax=Robiginitalea sp. IMCC44478 TaxID=3459122 RepID=UPI0040430279